jgi:hypothetical protein
MELWNELPLLNQSTMETEGSPAVRGEEPLSEEQTQQWHNESAFHARCLQEETASWDNDALRALAPALENGTTGPVYTSSVRSWPRRNGSSTACRH